jgi:PAS domain S-box-containing protein
MVAVCTDKTYVMDDTKPYRSDSNLKNPGACQETRLNEGGDESLRERADRYMALFQAANCAIFIMDKDRFIDFNPKTLEIFRCNAEQMTRRHPWEFSPEFQPDGSLSRQKAMERIDLAANGFPQFFEWQHCRCDGTLFDSEVSLNRVDLSGKVYIQAIVTDVTKRKEAERGLSVERKRFQILAENAPFGMVLSAHDGKFLYVNPKFVELFGYDIEDTPNGKTWCRRSYPDKKYRRQVLAAWIEDMGVARPREKRPRTFTVKCKDGTEKIVNFRAVLLEAGENIVTCEDITDRVRAQEELSAEKERLAVTLRSIADGVIATDVEGNIVLMNTMAETMTGWTQEEANGRNLREVFHAVDGKTRKATPSPVDTVLKAGKVLDIPDHQVLVLRDGREMIVSDSTAPIFGKDNRIVGAVLVFRDITEKHKLEEDLLRIDKLESVGVLAGGIAHDFNNILSVILGNISLAKMYVNPDYEKLQKRFSDAEQAILRAKDLTQQLLTFSRGGSPVKKTSAIQSVLKASCRFAVTGSNIQCEFDLPNDLLPVDIDAGQINQVIHNIVMNAQEAMAEGGTIHIKAENIVSSEKIAKQGLVMNQGEYVRIAIEDSGAGIPSENLGKIFDPYFTTKEQGSGLGLATSHSIIKRHGGCISAESLRGKGTTFYIYLPASPRSDQRAQSDGTPTTQGKGRILIMDDEDMIREITGELLQNLGYQVEFAKNGTEAIDIYRMAQELSRPFDAVILDLTVPGGMGGRETIKELLKIDPETKAIVSSGYSNDPIMAEFRKYGFRGVIIKPYRLTELCQTLQNVLMGSN